MTVCGLTESDAYSIYQTEFSGELDEDTFRRYYTRAAVFLSSITRRRSEQTITDEGIREMCMLSAFSVVEMMDQITQAGGSLAGGISSESNDGVSITYGSSKDTRTIEQRLYGAAAQYLGSTGLLYRGVR